MSLPLSAVVLTYNEEANLPDCLASLSGWVAEIFIVDSGSTDRTLEIAERFQVPVVAHRFENYARQRNWAQDSLPLNHEWVLHIDADERVTKELKASIHQLFQRRDLATVNGAMFSRRTVFMGRWIRHGGHYPVYHTRLFRRHKGKCEERLYDQHFLVEHPVVKLSGDLVDVLSSDLDTWTLRHVRWAAKEAEELTQNKTDSQAQVVAKWWGNPIERRRWLRKRLFGRVPLFVRGFGYFVYRYFFRFGFLDGIEGLIFHFLQGCWFRFYVDAKIWERRKELPHQADRSVTMD